MTTRADMIELAQKRAGLNRLAASKAAERSQIDTSCVYLTVRDIAALEGLSVDQVRYALAGVEPVKVPSVGTTSYAYGYSEAVAAEVFGNLRQRQH